MGRATKPSSRAWLLTGGSARRARWPAGAHRRRSTAFGGAAGWLAEHGHPRVLHLAAIVRGRVVAVIAETTLASADRKRLVDQGGAGAPKARSCLSAGGEQRRTRAMPWHWHSRSRLRSGTAVASTSSCARPPLGKSVRWPRASGAWADRIHANPSLFQIRAHVRNAQQPLSRRRSPPVLTFVVVGASFSLRTCLRMPP
jgi:hypothetical protein